MTDFYTNTYNPDVLDCLANLSNDEVFTPPGIVNQILDMLPQELFTDPHITFLDPVCKSGVFLREIAKRLLNGLEDQIPSLQERIDHILHRQLYGIAITELTSLLSRRSLYCSKFPNGPYSISRFDNGEGNIRFKKIQHQWRNKKCSLCGASKTEYDRDETLETYAYEFIHNTKPETIFHMKFDVIIGNPPYQLSDGGHGASALPIYQKFVQQAKKLNPRFLSMIIPARWYVGGRALDDFRNEMLTDNRIRILHDFPNTSECFPNVEIKGGVCFFLWDRDNRGECEVHEHLDNDTVVDARALLEEGMETFIRSSTSISILHKVRHRGGQLFSDHLNAGRYFGFHTKVEWDGNGNKIGKLQTADGQSNYPIRSNKDSIFSVKVYIARGECWIARNNVVRNSDDIDRYKIIIPEAGSPGIGNTIIGKPKISEPGSCNSNTYIVMILKENNLTFANNVLSYLTTRFVRFLISLRSTTQHIAPKAYSFVPMQDFREAWTDEKLYKKYRLTKKEIAFIESMIRPMDLESPDQ
ncbi:MAG: Eco57I restriction-modification methylase domain-containing protein [Candidatus Hydrogenedentales bacterium]|jgi:site-specific DNA-methyltransferase (adenine-specific)